MDNGARSISFSPGQEKILEVLGDGTLHHWKELREDDLGTMDNVKNQVSKLRKRLPADRVVHCHRSPNGPFYQLVRATDTVT